MEEFKRSEHDVGKANSFLLNGNALIYLETLVLPKGAR